jgi:serine protease Do
MTNLIKRYLPLFLSLIILLNFHPVNAASFNQDLREIRAEINRDNLQNAIKKIKKIKISNENEQEKIDLLFGDIYLKINQIDKAEEFYQKTFFTSNEEIEAKTFIGLAEVRLAQGKLSDAIKYAEQSIQINSNKVRPKIILAIGKTRIGEGEEGIKILNELYDNRKDAEVALAISDYYYSFDDSKQAIDILEEFIKRDPNNIKVLNQLASLHLFDGNKDQAIEYKLKVYKYYEFNRNRNKQKQAKAWILSIDPKYFDKPVKIKKEDKKEQEEYQEDEIDNYDENILTPNYEDIQFAYNWSGSGFVVGEGKYVVTNHHVIDGAKRIAVRNGLGKVREGSVLASSRDYDIALIELNKPYQKKFSLNHSNFDEGKPGDEIITIGFPSTGEGSLQPSITEGIITKTFESDYPVFHISAIINKGNSGGPIFNIHGNIVGIVFAGTDNLDFLEKKGFLPTSVGMGIKSKFILKMLNYKKKQKTIRKVSYSKSKLYEKMLGGVVFVAVQAEKAD